MSLAFRHERVGATGRAGSDMVLRAAFGLTKLAKFGRLSWTKSTGYTEYVWKSEQRQHWEDWLRRSYS